MLKSGVDILIIATGDEGISENRHATLGTPVKGPEGERQVRATPGVFLGKPL